MNDQSTPRSRVRYNDESDWFIPGRFSKSPHLNAIIDDAWMLLLETLPKKRTPHKQKAKLSALICDFMHAELMGRGLLRIRLDAQWYKSRATTAMRHPQQTAALPGLVKAAASMGIVEIVKKGEAGGPVSRIGPGPWLQERMPGLNLSLDDLGRDHEAPLIVLKEKKRRRGAPTKRISFNHRSQRARAMAKRIRAVNQRLEELAIDVQWDDAQGRCPWDHTDRQLHRVFTEGRGELDRYGRLHGGFWIGMPKQERWRIRIDGEPLDQLDFSGMFLSMLYALEGAQMPPGDPYLVEGLDRAQAKMLINARLFDEKDRRTWPKSEGAEAQAWPMSMTTMEALSRIAEKHPAIAHHIGPDTGLKDAIGQKLFLHESEIMLDVLDTCAASGIAALPIHDALLVKESQGGIAGQLMAIAFHSRLGAWPVIKATPVLHPTVQELRRDNGLGDDDAMLRSPDGFASPEWVLTEHTPIIVSRSRSTRRPGESGIISALVRTREGISSPSAGSILCQLMEVLSLRESELEELGASSSTKRRALRGSFRACVRGIKRPQLEALGSELVCAGMLPKRWTLPPSEHSKP